MSRKYPVDKTFVILALVLVVTGFFIFTSASLGLLARDGASFSSVAFSQIILGICGGLVAMWFGSQVHYRIWRKYALYFFIAAGLLSLAVFIPGIGFEHNGAQRWIIIGSFSLQPAEFLKLGFIVYVAALLSGLRHNITDLKLGVLPFALTLAAPCALLLLQRDTDTLAVMLAGAFAMFVVAGGKWKHLAMFGVLGIICIALLAMSRPYIMDRLTTFMDPNSDPQGSGYQIRQSLIAVGSGGWNGRGFGQSVQKFDYLPEPIGDSIFAVYAEEFGFMGGVALLSLLGALYARGLHIASRATDLFGMLLTTGFVVLFASQTFLNIAAMLALTPLSGLPLPFISHGGTAMFVLLASLGIITNISRYQKKVV